MLRRLAAVLLFAFAAHADVTAFVGVNVLPMDTERALLGQTVIVRDGSSRRSVPSTTSLFLKTRTSSTAAAGGSCRG